MGCEVVEHDVSADFECAAVVVSVCDPDEIPFGILCVTEKAAGLAAWLKFGVMIGYYARSASRSERLEMGKVRSVVEPQLEGGDVGWDR